MSNKLKIGILISGQGSNLQALIDACEQPDFPAEIVLVISNVKNAKGIEIAINANIPCFIIDHKKYINRENFEAVMTERLSEAKVELVCLAGFMRLLSKKFIKLWFNRLINIHPSLLPAFKGLNVHVRAIDAGAKFSGCTVHFVRKHMDNGPIIAQSVVPVHDDDTSNELAERILKQEHRLYPSVVRWFAEDRVKIQGERVVVTGIDHPETTVTNPSPAL
ncbi:MAG: phosphoribosylglycinamide formyltransferase [Magnetovibrio sp.]|nr:phosphoribosylglycinamide formyltransferase [Magnetovibrio sp.]